MLKDGENEGSLEKKEEGEICNLRNNGRSKSRGSYMESVHQVRENTGNSVNKFIRKY